MAEGDFQFDNVEPLDLNKFLDGQWDIYDQLEAVRVAKRVRPAHLDDTVGATPGWWRMAQRGKKTWWHLLVRAANFLGYAIVLVPKANMEDLNLARICAHSVKLDEEITMWIRTRTVDAAINVIARARHIASIMFSIQPGLSNQVCDKVITHLLEEDCRNIAREKALQKLK